MPNPYRKGRWLVFDSDGELTCFKIKEVYHGDPSSCHLCYKGRPCKGRTIWFRGYETKEYRGEVCLFYCRPVTLKERKAIKLIQNY